MRIGVQFALLAFSIPALAQDRDVSITWIGQSCFSIRTGGGPVVVTDPPVASVGYTMPKDNADVVTVSHNHTDHNNTAGVPGKFTVVDGRDVTARQEVTAAGMTFVLVPGYHDNQNGALRGQNTMIRWSQGGLSIVHLGDLGQEQLSDAQLADLRGADILFIPSGGTYTVDAARAAAYVTELKPRVAILMHFRTALGGPAQLASLPAAAAPFSPLVYKPATVTVNRASLPASTEVWLMEPSSDAVAVNAAGFTLGMPVAPGSVVSLFGNFAGSQTAALTSYPLPRKLGDTEVLVGGRAVPLYYVSPAQINAQVPGAQAPGQVLAEIRVAGQTRGRAPVTVVPNAPGIFAAANQDGRPNSVAAPARRGEVLLVFGTGLGATTPAVEDGAAAPAQPLASGTVLPNVFLGRQQLTVLFSGLAPGFAGLWQINVRLPADAPVDEPQSLWISSGLSSNRVAVAMAP